MLSQLVQIDLCLCLIDGLPVNLKPASVDSQGHSRLHHCNVTYTMSVLKFVEHLLQNVSYLAGRIPRD